ncbi:Uncharacterised protein [Moraxella lacunata]|uniref:Uncharacterized protein n=1 Tax=Moraxella lacunata TaxID=477 RepID=A0A378TTA0_MORLA|nr:Uncharacterised protein [Moraxella lacunata]
MGAYLVSMLQNEQQAFEYKVSQCHILGAKRKTDKWVGLLYLILDIQGANHIRPKINILSQGKLQFTPTNLPKGIVN